MADPKLDLDALAAEAGLTPKPSVDLDALAEEAGLSPLDTDPRLDLAAGIDAQQYAASNIPVTNEKIHELAYTTYRDALARGQTEEEATKAGQQAVEHFGVVSKGPVSSGEAHDIIGGYGSLGSAMLHGTIPITAAPEAPSERDERWRKLAKQGFGAGIEEAAFGGETMTDEEAKGAGVDKPWAQNLNQFGWNVLTAPLSPVASVVAAFGGDTHDLPTFSTIAHMGSDAADIIEGYGADTDVQKVVSPTGGMKLAARLGLATMARPWAYLREKSDAAIADALEGGHPEYAEKLRKASHDQSQMLEDAIYLPKFDEAARALYETNDQAAMDAVAYDDMPESLQSPLNYDAIFMAAATSSAPEMAILAEGVKRGAARVYLENEAKQLPIGTLRALVPDTIPADVVFTDTYKRRHDMQTLTGTEEVDTVLKLVSAGLVKKDDASGKVLFVPTKVQRAMSMAGGAEELIVEADIPVSWTPGVKGPQWAAEAMGYHQFAAALDNARIPTKAGWDSWVATGTLDPYLEAIGLRGSKGALLRAGQDTSYLGRVGANIAMPDYQGFGLTEALRRQGVAESSPVLAATAATDVAVDMLVPFDEMVLGPVADIGQGAKRAWVGWSKGTEAGLRGAERRAVMRAAAFPTYHGARDADEALHTAIQDGIKKTTDRGVRVTNKFGEGGTRAMEEAAQGPEEGALRATGLVDPAVDREARTLLEKAGIDPKEVVQAVNERADQAAKLMIDDTATMLARGGSAGDSVLRESVEYKRVKAAYDEGVRLKKWSQQDADVALRMKEGVAYRLVAEGKAADPIAAFGMEAVEHGGTPGPGAYWHAEGDPSADWIANGTDSAAFQRWNAGNKIDNGEPVKAYHGTTHEFDTFSDRGANPENHHGKAYYFSNQPRDAGSNYAGTGPDLTARIEQAAERIVNNAAEDEEFATDLVERYLQSGVTASDIETALKERSSPADWARYADSQGDPAKLLADIQENGAQWIVDDLAEQAAKWDASRTLKGTHDGAILPVYVTMKNPVDLRKGSATYFGIDLIEDEAGDIVDEAGPGADITRAAREVAQEFDDGGSYNTVGQLQSVFADFDSDGFSARDFEQAVRDNLSDLVDEDGESAGPGEFLRRVYQRAGYDGVIEDAYEKFGIRGRMDGVSEGTEHYAVFGPEQVKSASANSGEFDPRNPSILRAPGPTGKGSPRQLPSPSTPAVDRHPSDTWGDTRGPVQWHMPLAEVEARLVGNPEEHAIFYAGDGRQVARWGPEDTSKIPGANPRKVCVVYPRVLDELAKTGDGVYTHNHPSGSPPSVDDLYVAKRGDVRELRAIENGKDATWVVKRPEGGWPDRDVLSAAFAKWEARSFHDAGQAMNAAVHAAGGNVLDGDRAIGYTEDGWRKLSADSLIKHWSEYIEQPTGLKLEREAHRGQLGLDAAVPEHGQAAGTGPEASGIAQEVATNTPRTMTMFSGGGLVEEGLRGLIDPVAAVEVNPEIAAVYAKAHGPHVRVGDVRSVDLSDVGEVDYLHASPVCKNFSAAKVVTDAGEQPLDIETATATAAAIRSHKPRVFTLENVKGYQGSEAMKIVEDALTEEGYTFDARVYDAADYGSATHRDRLLLRAVKDGPLPPPPVPTHGAALTGKPYADWYGTVADIMDSLPDDQVPAWMRSRLVASGIDPDAPGKPVIVMGGSAGKNVPYAFAGGPAPTIKATAQEAHRIILPDGRVKRVTPQAMARITGLPDSYPLPKNRALATTIIGNGVPPDLARSVFGPLLHSPETLYEKTAGVIHGSIEPAPHSVVPPEIAKRVALVNEIEKGIKELDEKAARWDAREKSLQDFPEPNDPGWHEDVAEAAQARQAVADARQVVDARLMRAQASLAAAKKAGGLPREEAKYLIRFFQTADIKTLLHENMHLLRFQMGDEWVDQLVKFFDHEPDPGRAGKFRLTRAGEEQFADAATRVLAFRMRPNGAIRAYMDEFKATLTDLWMRVRGQPMGVPRKFHMWFDAALEPGKYLKSTMVDINPAGITASLPVAATEADQVERAAQETVKRRGALVQDVGVQRSVGSTMDALGVARNATKADALDVYAKAVADVALSHARATGGFSGNVQAVSSRAVVPVSRAKSVLDAARARMSSIFDGGTPKLDVETGTISLTPVEAAKMEQHVAYVANTGRGFESLNGPTGRNLLVPGRDFSTITQAEYEAINDATITISAGPGSGRTIAANKVAGNFVVSSFRGGMLAAERKQPKLKVLSQALQTAFSVQWKVDEYVAPEIAEVLKSTSRELGDISGWIVRTGARLKTMTPSASLEFITAQIAKGVPEQLVEAEDVPLLAALHDKYMSRKSVADLELGASIERKAEAVTAERKLATAEARWVRQDAKAPPTPEQLAARDTMRKATADIVTDAVNKVVTVQNLVTDLGDVSKLFGRSRISSPAIDAAEQSALTFLAKYRVTKLADMTPHEREMVERSVGTIYEGLRRRADAVASTGLQIGLAMSGQPEASVFAEAASQIHAQMAVYQLWHSGQWLDILAGTVGEGGVKTAHLPYMPEGKWGGFSGKGMATAERSGFDQQAATVAAIARLRAQHIVTAAMERMMDLGVPLDAEAASNAGRLFDKIVDIGESAQDRVTFREDVKHYMRAISNWGMTKTLLREDVDVLDDAGRVVGTKSVIVGTLPAPGLEPRPGARFNPEAYTAAASILDGWGYKAGHDVEWEQITLPNGVDVFLPKGWSAEVALAVDRGAKAGLAWTAAADSPDKMLGPIAKLRAHVSQGAAKTYAGAVANAQSGSILARAINSTIINLTDAAGFVYATSRIGMTTGFLLPNPANYIGNAFGGMLQAYAGKGAVGTTRMLSLYARGGPQGEFLRQLFFSMFNEGKGLPGKSFWERRGTVWVDPRGSIHTVDSIATDVARFGFNTSMARSESGIQLAAAMKKFDGTGWQRLMKDPMLESFVKRPVQYLQHVLTEASGAIDNFYRCAAYVDELGQGATKEEAAVVARRVAYDYASASEFEREVLRPTVMFYMYQRRNVDLFWWTLLNRPSRVLGTLRGVRDLQKYILGDDSELQWPDYLDGRMVAWMNETGEDSPLFQSRKGMAYVLPPLPVSDALVLQLRMINAIQGEPEAVREMVSMLSPYAQAPIVYGPGIEPFSGRDVERSGVIPQFLMDMDANLTGSRLSTWLGAKWEVSSDPGTGEVGKWVPSGPDGARRWWVLKNLFQLPPFGRASDTIDKMAKADVLAWRFPSGLVAASEVVGPVIEPFLPGEANPAYKHEIEANGVPAAGRRRPGVTSTEEVSNVIGIKTIPIDTLEMAKGRLMNDRDRTVDEATKDEKRSDPHRFGY